MAFTTITDAYNYLYQVYGNERTMEELRDAILDAGLRYEDVEDSPFWSALFEIRHDELPWYGGGALTPALAAQAEHIVDTTPELEPYRATILSDWPEGDEHWSWVCNASVAEIVDWAETIEEDGANG